MMSYSLDLVHLPFLDVASIFIRQRLSVGKAFLVGFPEMLLILGISWVYYSICEKPALDWFSHQRKLPSSPELPK